MMKRKINKNLKIILAILFVIFIILSITVFAIKYSYKNKERDSEYVRPEVIQPMFQEKFFSKYKGEINQEEILEDLSDFVYYLVDNKQNLDNLLDDDSILNEYSKNETFLKKIGFSTADEYSKIIKKIQEIGNDELDVSYTSFEVNTIINKENSIIVNFSVKFVDEDEITFLLEIQKTSENDNVISLSLI